MRPFHQQPDGLAQDGALAQQSAALVARLRVRKPRVHCITNTVAQNFTANVLLAAGCLPSMTLAADEIAGFVHSADALLVNLGTFDAERRAATAIAVDVAVREKKPWVLDPALIEASAPRAAFARALLARRPTAVRLNGPEFAALAQGAALEAFARAQATVVALSGETDGISDGARTLAVANGDPLMAKVTAMGCAASALIAAALTVERDALSATAAALTLIGVAGEIAAQTAQGPASFAVNIVDALYRVDAAGLAARARISAAKVS